MARICSVCTGNAFECVKFKPTAMMCALNIVKNRTTKYNKIAQTNSTHNTILL